MDLSQSLEMIPMIIEQIQFTLLVVCGKFSVSCTMNGDASDNSARMLKARCAENKRSSCSSRQRHVRSFV